MPTDESLIEQTAQDAKSTIVRSVIDQLQTMASDLQSGDDSGLETVWEEICVQVQGEESALYSSYEDLIDEFAVNELSGLDKETLSALWLRTDNGIEWLCDHEGKESAPYCIDDIASEICSLVLSEAADFENDRIYNHLWGLESEDEDDEDQGDEDDESSE